MPVNHVAASLVQQGPAVKEKKPGIQLDIEQYSVAQHLSQAQSTCSRFSFKDHARHLLLPHFLSYINSVSLTAFTAAVHELNNFLHLFPWLLIFPKHWFW